MDIKVVFVGELFAVTLRWHSDAPRAMLEMASCDHCVIQEYVPLLMDKYFHNTGQRNKIIIPHYYTDHCNRIEYLASILFHVIRGRRICFYSRLALIVKIESKSV